MRMKKLLSLLLALSMLLALTGTALADSIKIGAIYNLTGGQASLPV